MARYRKKPVEIDAHRWDGDWDALNSWLDSLGFQDGDDPALWIDDHDTTPLWIATLEGWLAAKPGDWIIRGLQGEFYPCKPDIFEATYEPVTQAPDVERDR